MIDGYIKDPKVVFEIGVGPVHSSRSRPYWSTAECHLFEPVKDFYDGICKETSSYPNVFVHNFAIYDREDVLTFWVSGPESCIDGINSPLSQQNFLPLNSVPPTPVRVKSKIISKFDKNNIDLLLLDMEGAEWFALKHLISRPKVIVVEMFVENPAFNNGFYKNEYTDEINTWMDSNNYIRFGELDSDVYWRRKDS